MSNTNSQRCRTCLAQGCKLIPLSAISKACENKLRLSDIFMICAAIQISPNDGFSQLACSECVISAEAAYHFKAQCEYSDKVWNQGRKPAKKKTLRSPNFHDSALTAIIPTLVKNTFEEDLPSPNFQDENPELIVKVETADEYKLTDDPEMATIELETEKFACNYCFAIFTDEAKLSVHELTHKSEPKLVVRNCRKKLKAKRSSTWPQSCNYCPMSLQSYEEKMMHLSAKHSDLKSFICKICGKKFFSEPSLKFHVKTHEEGKEHV